MVPNIVLIDHIVIKGQAITKAIINKIINDIRRANIGEALLNVFEHLVTFLKIRFVMFQY